MVNIGPFHPLNGKTLKILHQEMNLFKKGDSFNGLALIGTAKRGAYSFSRPFYNMHYIKHIRVKL